MENEKRSQLFKDFITGLQGIEGHYLKEARMNFLHEDERCILSFALKVGKLFSTIRKRANKLVSNFDAGLCNQRFAHAILDELQGYSHFLVLLEDGVFPYSDVSQQDVTLGHLYVWTLSVSRKLQELNRIQESVEGLTGSALVSSLYAFSLLGNQDVKSLSERLLLKAYEPLQEICKEFLLYGSLQQDYRHEFFIEKQITDNGATEFVFVPAKLPSLIKLNLADRILSIGKVSEILYLMGISTTKLLRDDSVEEEEEEFSLSKFIDKIEIQFNEQLVVSVFDKFHLLDHFKSLKQFMLLGQGDFIQTLLDFTIENSKKKFSKMELTFQLEQAIMNSNAEHNPFALEKLEIVLEEDLEMDEQITPSLDFLLLYNITEFPLNLIIDLREYLTCFRFLWKIRIVDGRLKLIWKNRDDLPSKTLLLLQEMLQFTSNLINYLMLEVIESSFNEFLVELKEQRRNKMFFEKLIETHKKFLTTIQNKGLMENELVHQLLKVILRFCGLFERFQYMLARQKHERLSLLKHKKELEWSLVSSSNRDNPKLTHRDSQDDEERAQDDLGNDYGHLFLTISKEFQRLINRLIDELERSLSEDLRFLGLRLDFSYFYLYN